MPHSTTPHSPISPGAGQEDTGQMRVVILAGGMGTRLSEETDTKPKPVVEIGEQPILWHIMKHYAHFGVKEFFIALGYKGEVIKRFMWDYCHLVDTGRDTMTGGRVKRLEPMLKD